MAKEDAVVEDKVVDENEPRFEVGLSDDIITNVEETVVKANSGKAKEELADEIEAAKTARLAEVKEESKSLIAKAEELAKVEENKDKTDDEIMELAQAAIVTAAERDDDEGDDKLTGFLGKEKKTEKTTPEGKVVPSEKLPEDVQAELEEYRKFKEDKGFLAYKEAKQSGDVDFIGMITQAGLAFDPKALSEDQLKRYELTQLQQANPAITNDHIEDIMSEFADKSIIERTQETIPIRAQIEAKQKDALSAFSTKVTSDANASRDKLTQVVTEAESELKTNYLGVEVFPSRVVDEEMMLKVINVIRSRGVTARTADGKPDVKGAIEEQLKVLNYSDSLDAAYLRGRKDESRKNSIRQGKPSGLKLRSSASKKSAVDPRTALREAQKAAGMV